MIYRAEIDGLRALSVISVVLFHAGFDIVKGGFVGVDIFFVISGYLITNLLIEDIENNKFNLCLFYERRMRRILPALVVVMLASTLAAWVFLLPPDLHKFGNILMGTSSFVSNIVLWKQEGYFIDAAELNPLIHTWSLAVEEQYYLLFPPFLFLIWHFGKHKVFWIICILTVLSLFLCEWGSRYKEVANFYLTPTRAWELLAGSIAAFIVNKKGIKKNEYISFLGLAGIIFSVVFYNKNMPFPSLYTLLPVISSVLFILFASVETKAAKILSKKVFVLIGLMSYSIYLWHQPLFAFAKTMSRTLDLQFSTNIFLVGVTFILAFFSWRFIEQPFRKRWSESQKKVFMCSILSMFMLAGLGFVSSYYIKDYEYKLAESLSQNDFVYVSNMDERKFVEGRLIFDLEKVDHVFVGSSRVMQINSDIVGADILNLSVSGASLEDDIAFLLEAVAKISPRAVYIGADPWLLNKHAHQNRYKSIENLYTYWISQLEGKSSTIYPFWNSVKTQNVQSGDFYGFLEKIYFTINLTHKGIPTNSDNEVTSKKAYDGSHIYDLSYENSSKTTRQHFDGILNYAMHTFSYNSEAENNLMRLIKFLKQQDIAVYLVLTPYHPELYQRMKSEKPIFLDMESKFQQIARESGIQLIGSYDPNLVGCSVQEFYDGMHPRVDCMRHVVASIKKLSNKKAVSG